MEVQQEKVNGNKVTLEEDGLVFKTKVTDETGALVITHKTLSKGMAVHFYDTVANVLSIKSIEAN